MTRSARPVFGTFVAAMALMLVVVACGNVTLTLSSPGAGGATPVGGNPQPGGGAASGAIVSATELEAALPSTLCGQPSTKGSATGTGTVDASAPPNPFSAFTGGSASGAFAWADPTAANCQTSAVALAAVGPLAGIIMSAIALSAMGSGSGSQITLGGKQVYKIVDTPTSLYVYAKGATLFGVQAATDDDAAAALQQMP